jgi:hypothetical protein
VVSRDTRSYEYELHLAQETWVCAYFHQSIPAPPKIAVRNHADRVAKLGLDVGRNGNHQPDDLLFDCRHLCFGESVVAILILLLRERMVKPCRGKGALTVQVRLTKFLKNRALAKRVVDWN